MKSLKLLLFLALATPLFTHDARAEKMQITSITSLGDLKAIGINDHSDVLVLVRKTNEICIWRHGKLIHSGQTAGHSWGAINNQGDIVFNRSLGQGRYVVCLLHGMRAKDINSPSLRDCTACGLNDRGEILISGNQGVGVFHDGKLRMVLPAIRDRLISPIAMNNRGDIAGSIVAKVSPRPHDYHEDAFVYSHGKITKLPGDKARYQHPFSVSNDGAIVGFSRPKGYPNSYTPVVWQSVTSTPIDLNTVLPKGSQIILKNAIAVNNRHQIVGWGLNGQQHLSFLLSYRVVRP